MYNENVGGDILIFFFPIIKLFDYREFDQFYAF